MPDIKASKEAKVALLQEWADVMAKLTTDFMQQCEHRNLNPDWFYPAKITQSGDQLHIHWDLRPAIKAALEVMKKGGSAEQAAKIGAEFDSRSLEQLITDDTVWVED